MTAGAIALIVLAVFVLIIAMSGVRIVPQARAGVVERLGRYTRTLDAGLTLIVPFIDRVKPLIDLREQVVAFPPQPVITEDNLVVGIDTVIYFTVTDPKAATYEIANPLQAIEQLTVTTLRNVIGGLTLEETLTSRDNINSQLRVVLDEATGKWGIRVNRVELKSVEPPRTVQEAMEKQMRAERDRRAAILTAEGTKQSQILTAEGEKQAAVLKAEGARTAAILRAEGESKAIDTVFQAIHDGAARPDAAVLPVPADAAVARAGLREQGVRDPVGLLAGARAHQRRPRAAAPARRRRRRASRGRGPTAPPTRRRARPPPTPRRPRARRGRPRRPPRARRGPWAAASARDSPRRAPARPAAARPGPGHRLPGVDRRRAALDALERRAELVRDDPRAPDLEAAPRAVAAAVGLEHADAAVLADDGSRRTERKPSAASAATARGSASGSLASTCSSRRSRQDLALRGAVRDGAGRVAVADVVELVGAELAAQQHDLVGAQLARRSAAARRASSARSPAPRHARDDQLEGVLALVAGGGPVVARRGVTVNERGARVAPPRLTRPASPAPGGRSRSPGRR